MRIGILTSGGDCPGLNAVIRGAVLKGIKVHGHEFVGFRDGWRGLLDGDTIELPRHMVRGISKQGGTILGTSRTNPCEGPNGGARNIRDTLAYLGIDAVIEDIGDIRYINTGDWVESCTAIAEHHDGTMELITWHQMRGGAVESEASGEADKLLAQLLTQRAA